MYNDVDMVWLKDPFPYWEGNHDIYFMDDMATVFNGTLFTVSSVICIPKLDNICSQNQILCVEPRIYATHIV